MCDGVIISLLKRNNTINKAIKMLVIKYVNNSNPFDHVNIFEDNSFVIVGDTDVSESDLATMVNWNDVDGWECQDV